jgi:hypothetical protein
MAILSLAEMAHEKDPVGMEAILSESENLRTPEDAILFSGKLAAQLPDGL